MNEQAFRVAVVQAAPPYLDLEAGVEKAVEWIALAAASGARFVAFPEVWLPGYPWWIWLGKDDRADLGQRYRAQAFAFGGRAEHMDGHQRGGHFW